MRLGMTLAELHALLEGEVGAKVDTRFKAGRHKATEADKSDQIKF
jgi:hypothetical protein